MILNFVNYMSLHFTLKQFLFVGNLNIKRFDVAFKGVRGSFGCFFKSCFLTFAVFVQLIP